MELRWVDSEGLYFKRADGVTVLLIPYTGGPGSTLAAMACVADAPSDGSTYGRKNGAWAAAGGGGGLTHPQVMARVSMGA